MLLWISRLLLALISFLLVVISLFYFATTIYHFPEAKQFSGNFIYNPYENLPEHSFRAHFHAHSVEWKGLTDGHNDEKDVFDAYTNRGYDIAGISN
ncbi:MAG: hypothetical protein ACK4GL_09395, partial [Flavobacteriales bacterium]